MGQHRRRARLPQEPLAGLGVAGVLRTDQLQGHLAAEDPVARAIDDPHASAAEAVENIEVGDCARLHEQDLAVGAVWLKGSLVDGRDASRD